MNLVIPDTERLTKARELKLALLNSPDPDAGRQFANAITEEITASIEAAFPALLKQATGLNQDRAINPKDNEHAK